MELDLEDPLSNLNDSFPAASTPSLFLLESHHMPTLYYINTLKATHLDISARREAISSISQVCNFREQELAVCKFISLMLDLLLCFSFLANSVPFYRILLSLILTGSYQAKE